jgi:O-antigen ligase
LLSYYVVIVSMPYWQHWFWNAEFAPSLTVTKLTGAIAVLYAVFYLARRHSIPLFFASPQSRWMVAFFGFAAFSYVTKQHASDVAALRPLATYVSSFFFFFVTMTVVDSVKRLYWSLMVAIGSVAFASLYMLREWQRGVQVYGEAFRPGYIVGDANYFTIAALAVLPIGFELLLVAKEKWTRLYCLGCMFVVFAAVTLGASRGGFLGIVTQGGYLVMRSRRPIRNFILVSLVALPFVIFSPNSPIRRFFSPSRGDTESVEKHLVGWEAGLNMVEQNPLSGVGLGNYKSVVSQYDTTGTVSSDPHIAHNGYLEVAAEMGIPSFLVYLGLLGGALWSLGRTRRRARARGADLLAALVLGVQAALLGVYVGIFFVSGEYTRLFWFDLCISMCVPALVPRRSQTPKLEPLEELPAAEPAFQIGEALVGMG